MFYDKVTVAQFCNLYIDGTEKVQIWDGEKQETVFEGTYHEAMDSDYADHEVLSFDIEDGLNCINI